MPDSSATAARRQRDYSRLRPDIAPAASREVRMQAVADALWDAFSKAGFSWVGFYVKPADRDELLLGPRRDKPACSPIGLHGACGRAWRERCPLVVRDVASLGENYVACDPRDRSEVVVPMLDPSGECWGVLDADSHEPGTFTEHDAEALVELLIRAGLSSASVATHAAVLL
ncbi:MAG TPA: GAF domain-containing protein [Phycisphaerales bacterium]|nr:GAF domain-containing protein [Phycisphaerales bacterium]